jgi:dTDP-4-amino-4,6-dideoxygalactose transaminase
MVLMNDFKAEPEELLQQELAAIERVLKSGWYILGNEVKNFEAAWAKCCGTSFAIGVGNGMDAIEIGLRSLKIGPGDEVITTPVTAFASVLAIIRAGATPVLADVDPTTALLDVASVERCLSSQTKAVLLVHLYGQIKDMEQWQTLCDRNNIYLLEDCAQAHLATWQGKVAGSFGTWGAYSFYPTKNLGAVGDGGALVTNAEEITRQAQMLRNYGQSQRYHHPELGLNSRLDELQAALLSVRLNWIDAFTTRRRQIAKAYFTKINNPYIRFLEKPLQAGSHVYHLFVVLCKQQDHLMEHLKTRGISSLIHYPVPMHHQIPGQHLKCDPQGLANAEVHAQSCLSIPCHPQMSDVDVERVITALNEYR